MEPVCFTWSGGKDSMLALKRIINSSTLKVDHLMTTLSNAYGRISMHGVREDLLDKQAANLNIPLKKIWLPERPSMEVYTEEMKKAYSQVKNNGIRKIVFGDIFLEDLKDYRDQMLSDIKLSGVYPIWKNPTKKLIEEFINDGFKAIVVCINTKLLDKSYLGKTIDHHFVEELPDNVDPCGENGEFHTFVYDGPLFKHPVDFSVGKSELRKLSESDQAGYDVNFWYCDLLPKSLNNDPI